MKLFTSTLITAAAALTLAGAAQAQVTVTTGGGYIKMVEALTAQYEKDTGAKVEKAFGGNIGQMLAQVESGSPVTVVVWRKGLTLASPEDLTSDAVKHVAMPDPKAAVYGRAAKEYLDGSGLAEKIAGKLNVVSMVPQVMSYVSRAEMDAGFVNLLAARQGKDKIGGFVAVKEGYEPIRMTAQPVKGAAGEADDVKAFLTWLGSPKADAVLEKFGVSR